MKDNLIFIIPTILLIVSCSSKQNTSQLENHKTTSINNEKLLNPQLCNKKASEKFKVKFNTIQERFIVEVNRDWVSQGADKFYSLVKNVFYLELVIYS